ncbi:myosin-16-like [Schistocerca americana]|uniref:myosin-16-like n=1 Tax=Schistocerca americana TaxID=7009 RepID=UPI001F4FB793|nr:myosin-16-like [Schistocerca americana]
MRAEIDERLGENLNKQLNVIKTELTEVQNTLEGNLQAIKLRVDNVEKKVIVFENEFIAENSNRVREIQELQNENESLDAKLDDLKANNINAISSVEKKVDSLESNITNKVDTLKTKINQVEEYVVNKNLNSHRPKFWDTIRENNHVERNKVTTSENKPDEDIAIVPEFYNWVENENLYNSEVSDKHYSYDLNKLFNENEKLCEEREMELNLTVDRMHDEESLDFDKNTKTNEVVGSCTEVSDGEINAVGEYQVFVKIISSELVNLCDNEVDNCEHYDEVSVVSNEEVDTHASEEQAIKLRVDNVEKKVIVFENEFIAENSNRVREIQELQNENESLDAKLDDLKANNINAISSVEKKVDSLESNITNKVDTLKTKINQVEEYVVNKNLNSHRPKFWDTIRENNHVERNKVTTSENKPDEDIAIVPEFYNWVENENLYNSEVSDKHYSYDLNKLFNENEKLCEEREMELNLTVDRMHDEESLDFDKNTKTNEVVGSCTEVSDGEINAVGEYQVFVKIISSELVNLCDNEVDNCEHYDEVSVVSNEEVDTHASEEQAIKLRVDNVEKKVIVFENEFIAENSNRVREIQELQNENESLDAKLDDLKANNINAISSVEKKVDSLESNITNKVDTLKTKINQVEEYVVNKNLNSHRPKFWDTIRENNHVERNKVTTSENKPDEDIAIVPEFYNWVENENLYNSEVSDKHYSYDLNKLFNENEKLCEEREMELNLTVDRMHDEESLDFDKNTKTNEVVGSCTEVSDGEINAVGEYQVFVKIISSELVNLCDNEVDNCEHYDEVSVVSNEEVDTHASEEQKDELSPHKQWDDRMLPPIVESNPDLP